MQGINAYGIGDNVIICNEDEIEAKYENMKNMRIQSNTSLILAEMKYSVKNTLAFLGNFSDEEKYNTESYISFLKKLFPQRNLDIEDTRELLAYFHPLRKTSLEDFFKEFQSEHVASDLLEQITLKNISKFSKHYLEHLENPFAFKPLPKPKLLSELFIVSEKVLERLNGVDYNDIPQNSYFSLSLGKLNSTQNLYLYGNEEICPLLLCGDSTTIPDSAYHIPDLYDDVNFYSIINYHKQLPSENYRIMNVLASSMGDAIDTVVNEVEHSPNSLKVNLLSGPSRVKFSSSVLKTMKNNGLSAVPYEMQFDIIEYNRRNKK